jgi:PAS domain S-box-containing protein
VQDWKAEQPEAEAVLSDLDARLSHSKVATESTYAAAEALGDALGADRAGYALADATVGAVLIEGLWGLTLDGDAVLQFEDFGVTSERLQTGTPFLVNDIVQEADARPEFMATLGRGVRALIVVPVHERGKIVAFMFAHSGSVRNWTAADLELAIAIAERARGARAQARIESRRRESDQQMMVFADTMPIQVWAADNYGMLYWHNRRVVEYSGAGNADLDGFGYQDIIHPDDLEKALDDWYKALADGVGHDTAFRTRRADGVYRWFVCRSEPIFDDEGNIIRYLGTSTDVHDMKSVEEELARINVDLEAEVAARTQERDLTWKTSSDLFVVTTPNMDSFRLNPAWTEMLGWTEAEILAREGASFIHPEDVEATIQSLAELDGDGSRVFFENRLLKRDGDHVWISWIVTRYGGMNYSTGRNVTAIKDLIRTQQELAHASRVATLGELTASIAHEVNQPLAAVVANGHAASRWLAREDPDLGEARAALGRMIDEAKRAAEIITRIRSLAMGGEPDRQPLNVGTLLNDSASLIRSQLRSLGSALNLDVASDLTEISADRVQMQQVIINLVLNGAQAMAQAGTDERQVDVIARMSGHDVEISVIDGGPGILACDADNVFDAFFTTKPDGMGMGLSIAKTIIEAHGGRLRLDQPRPRGTKFMITIPRLADD